MLSASPVREPAHRSFPKEAEDWDLERIIRDYGAAAERMQAGGGLMESRLRLTGIFSTVSGPLPPTSVRMNGAALWTIVFDSPGGSWNPSVNGSGLISSSACVWLPMKTGNLVYPEKKGLRLPAGWCKAERWIFSISFEDILKRTQSFQR